MTVRVPFRDLLADADRSAVGAFTCYDLEVATAVLGAAAARGRGVILLLGNALVHEPTAAVCCWRHWRPPPRRRTPARACSSTTATTSR